MSLKININFSILVNKLGRFLRKIKMEASAHHQVNDEYTEVYRRLPIWLQLSYGVGHVLNDVCASMWFTYLLVFFQLVLQFSNWEAGFLLLVGQVADALATPFVGYYSDQSDKFWFCKYGRRKMWHLIGTICVMGSFSFIFAPCTGCENSSKSAQMFYYCMFIIIFQFGWAAVQISHLSLIPELTPNEHDRTKLMAVRYCFTVISNVLVYVMYWFVLHVNSGGDSKIGPNDIAKFRIVVWAVLTFGVFCSAIFHIFVRETDNDSNNVRGSQLRTSVSDLLTNIKVYQVALIYMTSRLFVNLTQVFIPLYLHETLDLTANSLAIVPLIMYIGSFITSFLLEKINRCFGRKLTYTVGAILGIAACIWVGAGQGSDFVNYFIFIVAVLYGSGGSIILVTSLGITTDLIGEKTDSGAFVYGIMSFTDKLANGVAVSVIQSLHKDALNVKYYKNILTYVCGGSALMGTLSVICHNVRIRLINYETVPNYNSIN